MESWTDLQTMANGSTATWGGGSNVSWMSMLWSSAIDEVFVYASCRAEEEGQEVAK